MNAHRLSPHYLSIWYIPTGVWRYVEAGSFLIRVRTQEGDREEHKAGPTEDDPNTGPTPNNTSITRGEIHIHVLTGMYIHVLIKPYRSPIVVSKQILTLSTCIKL